MSIKGNEYDTSTLSDEELARRAQEELNMEGEMEEVRSFICATDMYTSEKSLPMVSRGIALWMKRTFLMI